MKLSYLPNLNFSVLLNSSQKSINLVKSPALVNGGKERQDSVYSALCSINANDKDLIIVHDAARPLLPQSILTEAIRTAKLKGNAVVGIKARDTLLLEGKNGYAYPDRKNIYYLQTPQIFTYKVLMKAMEAAYKKNVSGTDESVIAAGIGEHLNIVEGSILNFKITKPEDILILRKLLG